MRSLIFIALLTIVGFAIYVYSRPNERSDTIAEVADLQVAALELDDSPAFDADQLYAIPPPDSIEWLPEVHEKNDESFRHAVGNGRTRGGAHVVMGEGAVVFITDSIEPNDSEIDFENVDIPSGSPYGLWGAFGKKRNATAAEHSFPRMAKKALQHQEMNDWEIELIQLVSVTRLWAYDDDVIPTMKEIEDESVGTRALNAFETESIAKLQTGERLVIRRSEDSIGMVGAILASNKCLECHAGETDDLLGAFSYRLKRK